MLSLNKALNQSYNNARITKQTIKSIDDEKQLIHVESTAGIRLNIVGIPKYEIINVSHLLKQLLNINDKNVINKRIARWMRSKQGVWFVDNLMSGSSCWNEELAYSYNGNTLWEFELSDFDDSRVYKPIFTKEIIDAGIYDTKTNYFDLKRIDRSNGTNHQFDIITDKHSPECFDCYCCYSAVVEIFKLFKINYDRALDLIIKYVFNLLSCSRFKSMIKTYDDIKDSKIEFSLNNKGFISYKVIDNPSCWFSIAQRGFKPVNQDEYNIWSPIIGYSVIGHPEIPISAVDTEKVKTDANYTAENVINSQFNYFK